MNVHFPGVSVYGAGRFTNVPVPVSEIGVVVRVIPIFVKLKDIPEFGSVQSGMSAAKGSSTMVDACVNTVLRGIKPPRVPSTPGLNSAVMLSICVAVKKFTLQLGVEGTFQGTDR